MVDLLRDGLNPYCETPFVLPELSDHLVDISHLTDRPAWIVPGVKQPPVNMMRVKKCKRLVPLQSNRSADCIILAEPTKTCFGFGRSTNALRHLLNG